MTKQRVNIILLAIVGICAVNIAVLGIWLGNGVLLAAALGGGITALVVGVLILKRNRKRQKNPSEGST